MIRIERAAAAAARARTVAGSRFAFTNWLAFLMRLGTGALPCGPRTTTVHTVGGSSVTAPNTPMGRAPIWEIFASDAYPWEEILRLLPDEPVVLDIGAHVGAFTIAVAESRPRLSGACYEPSPWAFEMLTSNLEVNGLAGRVAARHSAVAAVPGETLFYEAEPGSCASSTIPFNGAEARSVPAVTLESALEDLATSDVDLLKLDCEGAEYEIVTNAPSLAWQSIGSIFLEYHPVDGRGYVDLEEPLLAAGYELVWREASLGNEAGLGLALFTRPAP